VAEPGNAAHLRQPVEQSGESQAQEEQPDDIQPRPRRGTRPRRKVRARTGSRTIVWQAAPGQHQPCDADWRVHEEYPSPAGIVMIRRLMTGPRIGTTATGRLTVGISRPSRFGPAARVISVVSNGSIRPPPAPCSTRKPIRLATFQAAPDAIEPMRKTLRLKSQTVRPPNRLSAQPLSGMTIPNDRRQPTIHNHYGDKQTLFLSLARDTLYGAFMPPEEEVVQMAASGSSAFLRAYRPGAFSG
jgi:hypothetical protein